MTTPQELPPLPRPRYTSTTDCIPLYSEHQMHDYARDAIAAAEQSAREGWRHATECDDARKAAEAQLRRAMELLEEAEDFLNGGGRAYDAYGFADRIGAFLAGEEAKEQG